MSEKKCVCVCHFCTCIECVCVCVFVCNCFLPFFQLFCLPVEIGWFLFVYLMFFSFFANQSLFVVFYHFLFVRYHYWLGWKGVYSTFKKCLFVNKCDGRNVDIESVENGRLHFYFTMESFPYDNANDIYMSNASSTPSEASIVQEEALQDLRRKVGFKFVCGNVNVNLGGCAIVYGERCRKCFKTKYFGIFR